MPCQLKWKHSIQVKNTLKKKVVRTVASKAYSWSPTIKPKAVPHPVCGPFSGLSFPAVGWDRLHFSLFHSWLGPECPVQTGRWECSPPARNQQANRLSHYINILAFLFYGLYAQINHGICAFKVDHKNKKQPELCQHVLTSLKSNKQNKMYKTVWPYK